MRSNFLALAVLALGLLGCDGPPAEEAPAEEAPAEPEVAALPADPLPSWNDTETKRSILRFVEEVTTEGHASFVPPAERVAVFDNDGTLWSEKPMYFQLLFAIDRVRALAPEHPEWREQEPFASVISGDLAAALAGGERAIIELVMATHGGTTTAEFDEVVRTWIGTARHPEKDRPYTELVYQPMLELLAFLRDRGFATWIVSGGGIDFLRIWAEGTYGVGPEQVIGSTIVVDYEDTDDGPVLRRRAELDFVDDKEGKPVAIHRHIGRRPIMAFGNSDGDTQMLRWTAAGAGARFAGLVHHTDAQREWAYDRESDVGRLDRALDEAGPADWTVVDMAADWATIFPPPGGGREGASAVSP